MWQNNIFGAAIYISQKSRYKANVFSYTRARRRLTKAVTSITYFTPTAVGGKILLYGIQFHIVVQKFEGKTRALRPFKIFHISNCILVIH